MSKGHSEAWVAQQAQLQHVRLCNGPVFRNNNGACTDETGRLIRYGLGNISKQMNDEIKSSDYIAITPTLILPHMVGYSLGVFTAYETKPEGWRLTPGDKRGNAQAKFHQIVRDACGFAGFVTGPDDVARIIGR
jgi:hypothetical protein